jgi:hypothetical protein
MDERYKSEVAQLIAKSLGWMVEESSIREGKLSPNEIVELTRKDCARGADGRPVLYSAPSPIFKRIKL